LINQKVELTVSPHEFFLEKIKTSSELNAVTLDKDTEFYLVNLLCQFIEPTNYFHVPEGIDFFNTPFALIFKKALESTPDRQILLYKLLGDASLYLCGLFQESFEKKKIKPDYVITLGSVSYERVAYLMRSNRSDSDFNRIYNSLAGSFEDIVKILLTISRDTFRANKLSFLLNKMDVQGSISRENLLLELERQGILGLKKRE
jgi:hypothetical protein